MYKRLIKKAIVIAGSQQRLAEMVNVSQSAVHKWLAKGQRVSTENAVLIEIATSGKVKAKDLRPDFFKKIEQISS